MRPSHHARLNVLQKNEEPRRNIETGGGCLVKGKWRDGISSLPQPFMIGTLLNPVAMEPMSRETYGLFGNGSDNAIDSDRF